MSAPSGSCGSQVMSEQMIAAIEAALKKGEHDEIRDTREALSEVLEDEEEI